MLLAAFFLFSGNAPAATRVSQWDQRSSACKSSISSLISPTTDNRHQDKTGTATPTRGHNYVVSRSFTFPRRHARCKTVCVKEHTEFTEVAPLTITD